MNLLYTVVFLLLSMIVYVLYRYHYSYRFIEEQRVLSYMKDTGAILIDVRSSYERKQGDPLQSLHLPIDRLVFDLERMIPDKTQSIVFCCKRAIRSEGAAVIARKLGYSNVSYTGNCEFI